jgi:hypothetical protein
MLDAGTPDWSGIDVTAAGSGRVKTKRSPATSVAGLG